MMKRHEFMPYTNILRYNNIIYHCGFLVKLLISKDGSIMICQDPNAARDLLTSWNMISTPISSPPSKSTARPRMITPFWSEKHHKAHPSSNIWSTRNGDAFSIVCRDFLLCSSFFLCLQVVLHLYSLSVIWTCTLSHFHFGVHYILSYVIFS